MHQRVKNVRLKFFWALLKVQNKEISMVPPEGKLRSGRRSTSVSRQQICQNLPNGHNAVRKAWGNLGVQSKMGQE
jgi:hypothetical protein